MPPSAPQACQPGRRFACWDMRVHAGLALMFLAACSAARVDAPVPPPPPPVTYSLTLTPTGVTLGIGARLQLAAQVTAFPGGVVAAPSVTFVSRTPAVMSVDATGLVTGLSNGSAKIVASVVYSGVTVSDSVALTVNQTCLGPFAVTVAPANSVITVGQHLTPSAHLNDTGCSVQPTEVFAWSAADPTVVSVDPLTGEMVGLKTGATVVRAQGTTTHLTGSITVTVQ